PLSGSAIIRILDKTGAKAFRGDLSDISASGISLIMNTSAQSAESLLGCRLNIKFSWPEAAPELKIDHDGRMVGIHGQMFNEYLINVTWDAPLEKEVVERIKLKGE
ncbi:MAG: hypothetical protein JRE18_06360, partial [Deltaproteobacteria bacterium]|nr:hypothetical protein [Deltaproteobacteria bacterium]